MEHPSTELGQLRAELAELRREVTALKAQRPDTSAVPRTVLPGHDVDEPDDVHGSNRRGFLRLAGAAAVGAGAAAIVTSTEPAAATTGLAVLIGTSNVATNVNETTRIFAPSGSTLDDQTFMVQNYTSGLVNPPSDHRVAVAGTTSGPDDSNGVRTGIYGRTSSPLGSGGQGVFGGAGGSTENVFAAASHFGVVGTGPADGYGVFGYCPTGTSAAAVVGRADEGVGVIAASITGLSLFVRDGGRMQQQLRAAGAPSAGSFSKGEMIRDASGDMYICTESGAPGTWRKVTAQHPLFADAGGSVNLLPRPIRLIDSRGNAAPITNGAVRFAPLVPLEAQITGTVADSLSVPAGARGILGNLTATDALGAGYALVWPTGQSQPATSNINFSLATSPAIANSFISALDASGKMNVMCAVAPTHLIVDVFGFIY